VGQFSVGLNRIMLTERFAAIAIFNRGNAPRRDVIIVPPQS
jgi:hypothetical protein